MQQGKRGAPRISLRGTPTFKGHVEKLQSAKELVEEGAEMGGALTLSGDSQGSCRQGPGEHRQLRQVLLTDQVRQEWRNKL